MLAARLVQEKVASGPQNVDMSQTVQCSNGREIDLASMAGLSDLCLERGQHFSSAPIRVDGMAVGTFCVVDRQERQDVDLDKLQKIADRAAELLQQKRSRNMERKKTRAESRVAPVVTALTAQSVVPHLQNRAQRMAIMLHTSNCLGCHELLPHFEQLAAKHVGKIEFATLNLDSGDVPLNDEAWKVDMVPAIVLVPGHDEARTEPMRYPGAPAPAKMEHIAEWLTSAGTASTASTAIVDLGLGREMDATNRGGKLLELSEDTTRQIRLLARVIDNENLSEETRRVATDKMEAHTAFQIRQGERAARLSQLAAEQLSEKQFGELKDSLLPVHPPDDEALGPAIKARIEFRAWLGQHRLLRHEASFVHVLGRDSGVTDLILLETEDIKALGWEMTRVERRRFEMAIDELRHATASLTGSTSS
jgi:thioredoxin-like negative regulator of GroEL